ncbi:FUSC family protein [Georgenia phoenicis]|uniref:FUSC family protein n=1 Tax=unclassified Georgenia TaxID=2626815 RepID=UPI0039AEC9BA
MTAPHRPARRQWRARVALPHDVSRLWWWREQWRRHPRWAVAIRAALAASIAWVVADFVPGPAADYPYYAPFGAVIATTFSLAGSVRESVQSVAAIAVGGLVGWLVDFIPVPEPLAVALVIVPAVVLAGWRRLGGMGSWVPTAALFTLIVGHGEATYVGAYAGLTLLGAAIGIAVLAVLPPLPLAPAQDAVARFRRTLAADLGELADLIEGEELPTLADWERDHAASPRERAQMHTAVSEVGEAAHRNRRARRYSGSIDALREEAVVLDRLGLVVSDLADLLLSEVGAGRADRSQLLAGDDGARVCEALRTISAALENTTPAGTADPHLGSDETPLSSAHATDAVREARNAAPREDEKVLYDGIVLSLERAVDSLARVERTD